MKVLPLFVVLAVLMPSSQAANSAFVTLQFAEVAKIALPRNWTYLDKQIADHLNTSVEASGRIAGFSIKQGDNKILVAANAYDETGKSKATVRLSVRMGQSPSQDDFRELAKQPPQSIQEALLPAAKETADAILKVPGIKSYKVLGVKLDHNEALHCTLSTFEGDYGGRLVILDTWVCPLGDRTLKLSTSYEKRHQAIYRPTIDYVWRSLSAK